MSNAVSLPTRISLLARRLVPERACGPLLHLLSYRGKSLLGAHGYGRSLKHRAPVDAQGSPIPWMPYWITFLLRERLTGAHRVFEYGSGSSTAFFSRCAGSVQAVEHDREWYEKVRQDLPDNATITFAGDQETYVGAVGTAGTAWDVVVVDGEFRVACVARALQHLSPGGVVVLDDSQRPTYQPAFPLAASAGFRWLSIEGHKPGSVSLHSSTVFYRDGNCLRI